MVKGFDEQAFMAYLEEKFNGFENPFLRGIVENIIEYAQRHEHISKDQFCWFLCDMIPEVEFCEIAQFAEDDILTDYGKGEKQKQLNKRR